MTPGWLAPSGLPPAFGATMSTRAGGVSVGPWAGMNLGDAVGDAPAAVARNRRSFEASIGARPVYLRQVHGTRVVRIGAADADAQDAAIIDAQGAAAARKPSAEADASVTTEPGIACTVLVADCLPVLFAAPEGRAAAAAHAGWRGLAGGVVEAALLAVCEAAGCAPRDVHCWLGACIGPRRFEVGADVLAAFGADPAHVDPARFVRSDPAAGATGKWLANLPGLAVDRLRAAGVRSVDGGVWCTVEDGARFFSFRRDRVTGRMAAAIWIRR